MLTKSDYLTVIAPILAKAYEELPPEKREAFGKLVLDKLTQNNPRFDQNKFINHVLALLVSGGKII